MENPQDDEIKSPVEEKYSEFDKLLNTVVPTTDAVEQDEEKVEDTESQEIVQQEEKEEKVEKDEVEELRVDSKEEEEELKEEEKEELKVEEKEEEKVEEELKVEEKEEEKAEEELKIEEKEEEELKVEGKEVEEEIKVDKAGEELKVDEKEEEETAEEIEKPENEENKEAGEDIVSEISVEKTQVSQESLVQPCHPEPDPEPELEQVSMTSAQSFRDEIANAEKTNEKTEVNITIKREIIDSERLKRIKRQNLFSPFLSVCSTEFRQKLGKNFKYNKSKGIKSFFKRISDHFKLNVYPFDDPHLVMSQSEAQDLLTRAVNEAKLLFAFQCLRKGYAYNYIQNRNMCVAESYVLFNKMAELETMKEIITELKESLLKKQFVLDNLHSLKEFDNIYNVMLPALLVFDSETLYKHGVSDCISSIAERKHLGYSVTKEDIDEMLDENLNVGGFGDFTPTGLHCPELFTTKDQLVKIMGVVKKIFNATDIRIREAAYKAMTNIFKCLSTEDKEAFFDEYDFPERISIARLMTSLDPCLSTKNERKDYFYYFYSALGIEKPQNEMIISSEDLACVLMYFYAVYKLEDANHFVFKLLSSEMLTGYWQNGVEKRSDKVDDRKRLIEAMHLLPKSLKKMIKIGEEWMEGDEEEEEETNSEETMYGQIGFLLRSSQIEKDCNRSLTNFLLAADPDNHIVSINRIIRYFIKCIQNGMRQKFAVACLNVLDDPRVRRLPISADTVHRLILLALSKYAVPTESFQPAKYNFINATLNSCLHIIKQKDLTVDEEYLVAEWKKLDHPWFSVLYLSQYFEVLDFKSIDHDFPWRVKNPENPDGYDEVVEKYGTAVILSTSWPDCVDVLFVHKILEDVLPKNVNVLVVMKSLAQEVKDLQINDSWKKALAESYEIFFNNYETEKGFYEEEKENCLTLPDYLIRLSEEDYEKLSLEEKQERRRKQKEYIEFIEAQEKKNSGK